MKHGPLTDPELLGLLREISADPESRLMKLATQGHDRRVRLHEPPISEREPFLTRAERHLLEEYRDQVGQWLFEAAKQAYLALPNTCAYRGSYAGWGRIRTRRELEAERESLLSRKPCELQSRACLEEIGGLVARDDIPLALSLASFRVAPRDSVRSMIGHGSFHLGRRTDGYRAWEEIRSHRPSTWYRSVADQNVAFYMAEEGRLSESKMRCLRAHSASEQRPEPLVGLLSVSLLAADPGGAIFAAARLSELPLEAVETCALEHLRIMAPLLGSREFGIHTSTARAIQDLALQLPQFGRDIAAGYLRVIGGP